MWKETFNKHRISCPNGIECVFALNKDEKEDEEEEVYLLHDSQSTIGRSRVRNQKKVTAVRGRLMCNLNRLTIIVSFFPNE